MAKDKAPILPSANNSVVEQLATELFVKIWSPSSSITNQHLATQCLNAANEFLQTIAAGPQPETKTE